MPELEALIDLNKYVEISKEHEFETPTDEILVQETEEIQIETKKSDIENFKNNELILNENELYLINFARSACAGDLSQSNSEYFKEGTPQYILLLDLLGYIPLFEYPVDTILSDSEEGMEVVDHNDSLNKKESKDISSILADCNDSSENSHSDSFSSYNRSFFEGNEQEEEYNDEDSIDQTTRRRKSISKAESKCQNNTDNIIFNLIDTMCEENFSMKTEMNQDNRNKAISEISDIPSLPENKENLKKELKITYTKKKPFQIALLDSSYIKKKNRQLMDFNPDNVYIPCGIDFLKMREIMVHFENLFLE